MEWFKMWNRHFRQISPCQVSAQMLRAASPTPTASFVRYANRRRGHQRMHTKRLIIGDISWFGRRYVPPTAASAPAVPPSRHSDFKCDISRPTVLCTGPTRSSIIMHGELGRAAVPAVAYPDWGVRPRPPNPRHKNFKLSLKRFRNCFVNKFTNLFLPYITALITTIDEPVLHVNLLTFTDIIGHYLWHLFYVLLYLYSVLILA